MILLITNICRKLKQAQMLFFIGKVPSLNTRWNNYSSSCRDISEGARVVYYGVVENVESNHDKERPANGRKRRPGMKGKIHIYVQVVHWI